ncbi:MAG: hypothetical protein C5B53_11455 [Candidatus Melainabacteria bacterium]|nr:MAG: hypothetical protein C5B53_11455 [Candidatus Melainabacteria bacterium]
MSHLIEHRPLGAGPSRVAFRSALATAAYQSTIATGKKPGAPVGLGLWHSSAIYAIFIFVLVNLIISPLFSCKREGLTKGEILSSRYEAMHQGPWSWWIARTALLKRPADLVLMGDSQINAAVFQADAYARLKAVDCAADRESISLEQLLKANTGKSYEVLNLSLGGAVASDQYLMAKTLFARALPKVVLIGVSPRCFVDNSLTSASATDPFQFFAPHVEMGSLSHLAFPDLLSELSFYAKDRLPMWILRDRFFNLFADTKGNLPVAGTQSTAAKEATATPSQMLRGIYGSATDVKQGAFLVSPMIITGFYDNTKEYQHRWRNWDVPAYGIQKKFFDAYLTTLNQLGIKTVVVGMPCTSENRQLLPKTFWGEYRDWLTRECLAHGALWFDLSEDPAFGKKHFLDTVHVNAFGARLLVQKIASLLVTNPELSRKLKDNGFCQAPSQRL